MLHAIRLGEITIRHRQARAKVIRDYLIQNFRLDDKRVKTISLGKPKELAESSKVVILVYPPKAPAGPPHASSGL